MCEAMAFRKQLIDLLSYEFRSASSLARELGMTRGDVEDDLRHALRSARRRSRHRDRAGPLQVVRVRVRRRPCAETRAMPAVQGIAAVRADDSHPAESALT